MVTDDTKLWGTAIQSTLIKLEKWAARDIVESDKDKLEIDYTELINLMQQHSLGLDWQVCRNRLKNPGGQQVWVSSALFCLVPYQSALGDCNQKVEREVIFPIDSALVRLHLEQFAHVWYPKCQKVCPNALRPISGKYMA